MSRASYADLPLSQLVREEKLTHAALLQLAIRQERLIEKFHEQMADICAARATSQRELQSIRSHVATKRRQLELMSCPPELRRWQIVQGHLDSDDVSHVAELLGDAGQMFADTASSAAPLNVHDKIRVEEGCVSRYSIRLERAACPQALLQKAFVPCRAPQDGAVKRRPVLGDVGVMSSSSLGRVLVSLQPVRAGMCVFAEAPWLAVPTQDEADVELDLLPPVLQDVQRRVLSQSDVFRSHLDWDRHLVAPWLCYLESLIASRCDGQSQLDPSATAVTNLVVSLCNPLQIMSADRVNRLFSFAQFLHCALPAHLQQVLSAEETVKFLATYMVNAVAFTGVQPSSGMLDPRGRMLSTVYAQSTSCRCLFGLVSLLEHDCNPNCALIAHRSSDSTDDDSVVVEVRAIKPIAEGDRLSISYVPLFLSRQERHEILRNRYFFTCCCEEVDLSREVRLRNGAVLAPIGDGRTWRVDGCTIAQADAPDVVEGVVAERQALGELSGISSGDGDRALQVFAMWCEAETQLGWLHYGRIGLWLGVCKHTAACERIPDHTLERMTHYAASAAGRVFDDSGDVFGLPQLLVSSSPLQELFDFLEKASEIPYALKERVLSGTVQSLGGCAARCVRLRPDATVAALHGCCAVWEALFAAVHARCQKPSDTDHSETVRLQALRVALCLGLWLMLQHAMHLKHSDRALHWQAVLLEIEGRI